MRALHPGFFIGADDGMDEMDITQFALCPMAVNDPDTS